MRDVDAAPVWKSYGPRPRGARGAETLETVIVGGGPVGLALALDLGRRGRRVVVLNRLTFIPRGSKAICFSKRSLEIFDRLGVAAPIMEKGVAWEKGKVFWRDDPHPIYEFDLAPVKDQKFPAFINIQQYYVEQYLIDAIENLDNIEIRWGHEVVGVDARKDGVAISVSTSDGNYAIDARYLLACDGARSSVRTMLGLDFSGRAFQDSFLIADVKFSRERPAERWFHFDPPYPGRSSLIHRQPDGVWRLDFQLGPSVDRNEAIKPENVEPYVRGMLGPDAAFAYEWLSVYTFQCRRMERFVHDRVIFAGDAAHVVSPFGARGCNGGLQDVDNLGWKLDAVLNGTAFPDLLETYNEEAIVTADENILNSSRATDFMTPRSEMARCLRDAVLELSKHYEFARPFVNSGRLSTPVSYLSSSLNAGSSSGFDGGVAPGAVCVDAPVDRPAGEDWLLCRLGWRFSVLHFTEDDDEPRRLRNALGDHSTVLQLARRGEPDECRLVDRKGLAHERYDAQDGAVYLVRPDQHVLGRWRKVEAQTILAALKPCRLL